MEFVESDLKLLLIFRNKNVELSDEEIDPLQAYRTLYLEKPEWPA